MKKTLSLILALTLVVCAFSGCTGGTGTDTTAAPTGDGTTEAVYTLMELSSIIDSGVLKVGMECNYAPFNWTQTEPSDTAIAIEAGGYADGYDVQMAKRIAEALGVELKIVKTEWDGLAPALTSGKIDMIIAGMSPTAERKLTIDFTDYYYESELVIVVLKNGKYASATYLDDFAGAKITGQLNTFHYDVIDQINGVTKSTALSDFPAMIVALQSGAVDGYVSELPGAVSASSANSDITYVQFADGKGFNTSPDDVAISVGIRKGSDLAGKTNEILAGISAETRLEMMNTAVKNQPLNEE